MAGATAAETMTTAAFEIMDTEGEAQVHIAGVRALMGVTGEVIVDIL